MGKLAPVGPVRRIRARICPLSGSHQPKRRHAPLAHLPRPHTLAPAHDLLEVGFEHVSVTGRVSPPLSPHETQHLGRKLRAASSWPCPAECSPGTDLPPFARWPACRMLARMRGTLEIGAPSPRMSSPGGTWRVECTFQPACVFRWLNKGLNRVCGGCATHGRAPCIPSCVC